jgi:RNA polymerase sigma factor (sigma-70 family)
MEAKENNLLESWIRERNADAFAEIVGRHGSMVYGTCKRVLGNATEAEDIAQECFLQLACQRKPVRSLGGWLHRVATNRSIDKLRKDNSRSNREKALQPIREGTEPEWNDIKGFIDEAIVSLPDRVREPLIRHYFEGQTYDSIAKLTELPRSTVANRVQHGVELIRKNLKRKGIAVPGTALAAMFVEAGAETLPATLSVALGKIAIAGTANVTTTVISGLVTAKGVLATVLTLVVCTVAATTILWDKFDTGKEANEEKEIPYLIAEKTAEGSTDLGATIPKKRNTKNSSTFGDIWNNIQKRLGQGVLTSEDLGTIEGVVLDTEGKAIEGIRVLAYVQDNAIDAKSDRPGKYKISDLSPNGFTMSFRDNLVEAKTDRHGAFRISDLPPNTYDICLRSHSTQVCDPITLDRGEHKRSIQLIWQPVLTISGTVMDTQGKPIANADISPRFVDWKMDIRSELFVTTQSDERGEYVVDDIPDMEGNSMVLSVNHQDYAHEQRYDVIPGTEQNFVLEELPKITGKVFDSSTNQPIKEFQVAAWITYQDEMEHITNYFGQRDSMKDSDGRFTVKPRRGYGNITVAALAPGYVLAVKHLRNLGPGEVADNVVLRLNASRIITGVVVDEADNAIADAEVFIGFTAPSVKDSKTVGVRTKHNGEFRIDLFLPNVSVLSARHSKYAVGRTEVDEWTNQVRIVLTDGAVLEGILTIDGVPVTGREEAYVLLGQSDAYKTSASGWYEINKLTPGDVQTRVYRNAHGSAYSPKDTEWWIERVITLQQDERTRADFDFTSYGSFAEGIVLLDGFPPKYCKVLAIHLLSNGDIEYFMTLTNETGYYQLVGIPAGSIELEVRPQAYSGEYLEPQSFVVQTEDDTVLRQDFDLASVVHTSN